MSRDGNFTASRISDVDMSLHSNANVRYKNYLKKNGEPSGINSGDSLFQESST